jgi:iron complex transport system permease protein
MIRLLALLCLALAAASLAIGPVDLASVWARDPELARTLFVELRLPRTGLALAIGAGLGGAGAATQALLRNPLASPDVLGPSTGAALGAVLAGYFLGAGVIGMAAGGIMGALAALLLLLGLAGFGAGPAAGSTRLVLAGVAVATLLGVAINLALSLAPSPFALYDLMIWLMGSLADRTLPQLLIAAPLIALGLALLVRAAPALDALALGEEVAQSLGVATAGLNRHIIIAVALATGAGVAVAGSIGFVGLVVPHLVRPFTGHRPGAAIVPAAIAGAALLLAADIAVRLLPLDLRLGVLTALIGAPIFLSLILRGR